MTFTWPGCQPAWANKAAWESPSTPVTGVLAGSGSRPRQLVNGPVEPTTVGSAWTGTPNRSSSHGSQVRVPMSSSWVRAALPASMRCSPPSCHSSQESTVPRHSSPRVLRDRAGSWSSSSAAAFEAENMASNGSPVTERMRSVRSADRRLAHSAAPRVSCQPRTGPSGSPVRRSHSSIDSRCVLNPTAATCAGSTPASAVRTACCTEPQISWASCSAHPGRGCRCPMGTEPRERIVPALSTTTHFVALVPWSIATTRGAAEAGAASPLPHPPGRMSPELISASPFIFE